MLSSSGWKKEILHQFNYFMTLVVPTKDYRLVIVNPPFATYKVKCCSSLCHGVHGLCSNVLNGPYSIFLHVDLRVKHIMKIVCFRRDPPLIFDKMVSTDCIQGIVLRNCTPL